MQQIERGERVVAEFSLKELAEILVKHKGLHEGRYNLALQFRVGFGSIGPESPDEVYPGAVIVLTRIGLAATPEGKENIHTVDAAEVNPATP